MRVARFSLFVLTGMCEYIGSTLVFYDGIGSCGAAFCVMAFTFVVLSNTGAVELDSMLWRFRN